VGLHLQGRILILRGVPSSETSITIGLNSVTRRYIIILTVTALRTTNPICFVVSSLNKFHRWTTIIPSHFSFDSMKKRSKNIWLKNHSVTIVQLRKTILRNCGCQFPWCALALMDSANSFTTCWLTLFISQNCLSQVTFFRLLYEVYFKMTKRNFLNYMHLYLSS
jgi:hypothetical protein